MPLANTPLPSLIVPFCARIYGGPQLSRQNQKPHGKNKIPHGKTENFVYFVFAEKFLVSP